MKKREGREETATYGVVRNNIFIITGGGGTEHFFF
jgi:hypothetical protein